MTFLSYFLIGSGCFSVYTSDTCPWGKGQAITLGLLGIAAGIYLLVGN